MAFTATGKSQISDTVSICSNSVVGLAAVFPHGYFSDLDLLEGHQNRLTRLQDVIKA